MIGQIFNRLTILEKVKRHKRTYWKCQCICGNINFVRYDHLSTNKIQSCGCIAREKARARKGCISKNLLPDNGGAKRKLYYRYRQDANIRNIVFNIEINDFINLILQPCHYCFKQPDKLSKNSGSRSQVYYTGLDRKNNKEGYYKENIVPCCTQCNMIKNDILTYEEMKVAMNAVLKLRSDDNIK